MRTNLLPVGAATDPRPTEPPAVAEAFLAALAESDLDDAIAYLDDDVVYTNVGLPTVRGSHNVAKAFGSFERFDMGFEVYLHSISADGPVVLTERTDVITIGPLRIQFWVWGRFDVHDGRITLWRDSFDFLDTTKAMARAVAALAVPRLRPAPPSAGDAPGR